MNIFFALFLAIHTLTAAAHSSGLRAGDILLQPLKCWACSLIEAEEETIYSHIGIVLSTHPEIVVGEAFGKVKKVSLREFDSKTEPGQKLMVLRYRNERLSRDIHTNSKLLLSTFDRYFLNAQYDHDFRWNNFDQSGNEKFYCSELVSKLLQGFIGLETPVKRMHFQKNREHWRKYFRGNIPDNEWGNSPGDFERSELFYKLGEL